jgi:hypothetical protein
MQDLNLCSTFNALYNISKHTHRLFLLLLFFILQYNLILQHVEIVSEI